ncbi:MAG: acyltransferase [Marinilabiliales bacterium]
MLSKYHNQLVNNTESFKDTVLKIYQYQYNKNKIYRKYIDLLGRNNKKISQIENIPFLPVELFKYHKILCEEKYDIVFYSSGTTSSEKSVHYVHDLKLYEESALKSFTNFYGHPGKYCFLALLPGYVENKSSSLVYMLNYFINIGKHPDSGFYLYEHEQLLKKLFKLEKEKQKAILFGVTHALLDLADKIDFPLNNTIIIETGGMKGLKKELTKAELYEILKNKYQTDRIHSEYGMTELLSQAYAKKDARFYPPSWMRIFIRDLYDPFNILPHGKKGAINIIDLANYHSCSFIATSDIGISYQDGSFEVLGRVDKSDIRGCNLLVENV